MSTATQSKHMPHVLCQHCGEAIEPTGGRLYLWTHIDPNQQKCIVAKPANGVVYSRDNFSAEAIEHRFSCGSWDEKDVRYCIHALRTAPAMLEALESFIDDAYVDSTLCGWCGYRTELGGGHIHSAVCRVGKAEAAIRLAKGEL